MKINRTKSDIHDIKESDNSANRKREYSNYSETPLLTTISTYSRAGSKSKVQLKGSAELIEYFNLRAVYNCRLPLSDPHISNIYCHLPINNYFD